MSKVMDKPKRRITPYSIRMSPDLRAEIDIIAEDENRTVHNTIQTLLLEAIKARAKRKR